MIIEDVLVSNNKGLVTITTTGESGEMIFQRWIL